MGLKVGDKVKTTDEFNMHCREDWHVKSNIINEVVNNVFYINGRRYFESNLELIND